MKTPLCEGRLNHYLHSLISLYIIMIHEKYHLFIGNS